MGANPLHVDPDVGIPDLVRRLTDDGKRLIADEIRLAKLETRDHVDRAGQGGVRLALAFGTGVICLVGLTILVSTLVGRIANGHMWLGAIATGIVEVALAAMLIRRGVSALAEPSYTLEQTRESLTGRNPGRSFRQP